jgi:surfactin synthase thioesterase subunit
MLLCTPHAGAGPSVFSRWAQLKPPDIAIVGIRLPGRESRISEAPLTSLAEMARAIAGELLAHDIPVWLYGHCFGAVLSFHVATELTIAGVPPQRLLVSSSPAPDQVSKIPVSSDMPTPEFVSALKRIGQPVDEATWPVTEEAIRGDFRALETREPFSAPLRCPITALHGELDAMVSRADMCTWSAYTRRTFNLRELPAGHMLINELPEALLKALVDDIRSDLTARHEMLGTVRAGQ